MGGLRPAGPPFLRRLPGGPAPHGDEAGGRRESTMEETLHSLAEGRYDRLWQRVAPALEPYPTGGAPDQTAMPVPAAMPAPVAASTPQAAAAGREARLPGAEADPCCMGSAAADSLEVVTGFIEEELTDQRYFLALARQAPAWARQPLRELAAGAQAHARRLMAAYYLTTGESYCPAVSLERIYVGRWCPALRERYHAEACSGFNYARAAEETTDPCLAALLRALSGEEFRRAETLARMLERSLPV